MRVLIFGDSIAQGFWDTDGGWVQRIRKNYDLEAIKDLRADNPEIFNVGISGETTKGLLSRIRSETEARIWKPGDDIAVIVAIGTNDNLFEGNEQWIGPEEFRQNLGQIIDILQSFTNRILFVGNNSVDEALTVPVSWGDYSYTNEQLQRFEAIIQDVAQQKGAAFVPIFERFQDEQSVTNLLEDGLHPNNAGHELLATMIRPALDKLLS